MPRVLCRFRWFTSYPECARAVKSSDFAEVQALAAPLLSSHRQFFGSLFISTLITAFTGFRAITDLFKDQNPVFEKIRHIHNMFSALMPRGSIPFIVDHSMLNYFLTPVGLIAFFGTIVGLWTLFVWVLGLQRTIPMRQNKQFLLRKFATGLSVMGRSIVLGHELTPVIAHRKASVDWENAVAYALGSLAAWYLARHLHFTLPNRPPLPSLLPQKLRPSA